MHLAKGLQKECFNALLESITEENVIEVLLGCEKLQVGLSRMKLQQHAQAVQTLVADVAEYCTEFLVTSLDSLIQSESFSASGMVSQFASFLVATCPWPTPQLFFRTWRSTCPSWRTFYRH
jgi:hypothetical protein